MLHIEMISATLGLVGALLLATKTRFAGWAFVAWLASNVGWIFFGAGNNHWFFLLQQLGFLVTSIMGIYTWLIAPKPTDLEEALQHLRTLSQDARSIPYGQADERPARAPTRGPVTLAQLRAAAAFVDRMDAGGRP